MWFGDGGSDKKTGSKGGDVLLGVRRMDKIRNIYIRVTAKTEWIGDKVKEVGWFGHVQRPCI